MTTSAPLVAVSGLKKVYKVGFLGRPVVACRDVSLTVPSATVFGLVGPNGAGKSTAIKMLLGLVRPDAGGGTILGHPLGSMASRARTGYLPELPSFPRYLTAREVLDFHARLSGVHHSGWAQKRDQLLERTGLSRAAGMRLQHYSKGMLQRCALAVALCADPQVLVLDEPMSGLDPLGRHDVRTLMVEQRQLGRTVLFSSHVLSDVAALCDNVAILSQGSVFRAGPLKDVLAGTNSGAEVELVNLPASAEPQVTAFGSLRRQGDAVVLQLADPSRVDELLGVALQQGASVRAVTPRAGSLEQLVLEAERVANSADRVSPVAGGVRT